MRVLIVSSPKFPVPATKGGAVQNLIEEIIAQNEKERKIEAFCCSIYDEEAEKCSEKYKGTEFIWCKVPKIISAIDKMVYFILKHLLRIKRLVSLSFLFQMVWYSYFVAKVLRRRSFDRVIFENSIPVMLSMNLHRNRRKYKDRYYLHMHSVPRKYYGTEKIISKSAGLICISDYVADEMTKGGQLKIEKDKIYIMYNCLNTDVFKPILYDESKEIRKLYNIPENKKIVLFAGRLCPEKGIAELLQMMQKLDREDVVLLVVGSNFYKSQIISPYEEYLKQLCDPVKDKVIFTGYIDYENMPKYYAVADCVTLPSMWEEPAGMTIIEAMACGRPVITTYSGGIPEYVGKGNCIVLERDNIIEKLAKSVGAILDNEEEAEELSKKAEIRASRYNQEFYYSQLLSILGIE